MVLNMSLWSSYLIGCFIGILIGMFLRKGRKPDGELKVDVSDPRKDKYLLEFHIPLDDIPGKKSVKLRVVNVAYDPNSNV